MKAISRTLIIGLGGTGQKVILDIKKKLLRTYGEIPPLVKFLAFDTDEMYRDGRPFRYYYGGESHEDFRYLIQNNEFYRIPCASPDVVRNDEICLEKINLAEFEQVAPRLSNWGTSAIRVVGRASFLNASGNIINILSQTITSLRLANLTANDQARGYNVVNTSLSVYVVASLAGGTGSSAIMDMSRMLQIAGISTQYNAFGNYLDRLFGMFFLPRFFEARPNTPNIRVNAYTALSELDYTLRLNDPALYPMGSKELDDDSQDYHGHVNHGKRVIYDGVYLIDFLASNGFTHRLEEASSYVASFIASSIAANANVLEANYVNFDHKMRTVNGKSQNYSGLGYCELRFNRQDLVKYLLNRKLIGFMEQYKAGAHQFYASQIAQEFITINRLNEGVMKDAWGEDTRLQLNELTDDIINMIDSRFTAITMERIDTGSEAADNIESAKGNYLRHIGAVAQQAVQAFNERKEELRQSLRNMLDERMKEKGFAMFPELVRCLKSMLTEMKCGLEVELNLNETLFDRIDQYELPNLKRVIADNSPKFIIGRAKRRDEQMSVINMYLNKVLYDRGCTSAPTLAWLIVDSARKKEAVAVYEELIKILDSYYREETIETVNGPINRVSGAFLAVDRVYKELMDLLTRENNAYRPSKTAVNETILADAYFKEYLEQHETDTMGLREQEKYALEHYMKNLFADRQQKVDEEKLAEMRQELLNLLPANGIIREIQEGRMSIDDLFIHCFGRFGDIRDSNNLEANPQLKMLDQLNHVLVPLWCHSDFRGLAPVRNVVVGVCDPWNHIFNTPNGYQAALNRWNINGYDYICLGDPDRISFMMTETAIPAFKLMGVNYWADEYNHRKPVYAFSDKRLEGIDMIMPETNEEKVDEV